MYEVAQLKRHAHPFANPDDHPRCRQGVPADPEEVRFLIGHRGAEYLLPDVG